MKNLTAAFALVLSGCGSMPFIQGPEVSESACTASCDAHFDQCPQIFAGFPERGAVECPAEHNNCLRSCATRHPAAHTAAIEAGGSTIAVLGTPITSCYPPANSDLQKRIADQFLVISQVPIVRYSRQGPHGNRLFFPERNATMSALTEATVIVEAGNTSGTLIQARHALQQRRKLFILESCFRNPQLTWPAKFVERGAIRVAEFEEIKAHLAS